MPVQTSGMAAARQDRSRAGGWLIVVGTLLGMLGIAGVGLTGYLSFSPHPLHVGKWTLAGPKCREYMRAIQTSSGTSTTLEMLYTAPLNTTNGSRPSGATTVVLWSNPAAPGVGNPGFGSIEQIRWQWNGYLATSRD